MMVHCCQPEVVLHDGVDPIVAARQCSSIIDDGVFNVDRGDFLAQH